MYVHIKFDDSALNSGRIIRLLARSHPFYALFVQYLIAFCGRPEAASDSRVVAPSVPNKHVKFGGSCTKRSREIPPKAI